MRAILALLIVLAVAFVYVGTSAAAPGGDVKASPLFKASLQSSIAKLEGKSEDQNEALPTTPAVCPKPDQLYTSGSEETCYETCGATCGLPTCGGPFTCGGSTCGGETCSSTCAATCAGSGPTYQGGACCNARYYGTISWRNMYNGGNGYPYPSSGPSTDWTGYLSPYYALEDQHYVQAAIGGVVDFRYGSGYSENIRIGNFSASNGTYDGTKTVPNVSSYSIRSYMTSYYNRNIDTNEHHYTWTDINEQPVSAKQVNQTKAIVRP